MAPISSILDKGFISTDLLLSDDPRVLEDLIEIEVEEVGLPFSSLSSETSSETAILTIK